MAHWLRYLIYFRQALWWDVPLYGYTTLLLAPALTLAFIPRLLSWRLLAAKFKTSSIH